MSESRLRGIVLLSLLICAGDAAGSEPTKGPEIRISRATGPILVDGDLDDPGWQGVPPIDTWYEINRATTCRRSCRTSRTSRTTTSFSTRASASRIPTRPKSARRTPTGTTSRGTRTTAASSSTRRARGRTQSCSSRTRANIRPTNHLELQFDGDLRWLNVKPFEGGEERRLFTAQVERLKATYNFTARSYLRLIGQYVWTKRDPSLYADPVAERDGSFSGSFLFAYKLNWQTVLFLGYGDNRTLTEENRLEKADRQFFLKVAYAFQR